MNLRTRGIVFSLLPLFITLSLAIPAAVVVYTASQADARASHSDFLREVAHDVEEASLDFGDETRNIARNVAGAQLQYAQSASEMTYGAARLQALASGDPETQKAAGRVAGAIAAYIRIGRLVLRDTGRTGFGRVFTSPASRNFALAGSRVRLSVRTFDDLAHSSELTALAAIDQLWRSSLLLLAILIGGLTVTSALLGYSTVNTINAILELGRKADSYRLGEPLGTRSARRDEIGQFDRSVHALVAVQQERERELQRYRLLSEVTHDIILFIDRSDLTIIDANAAALATYGYGTLIGRPASVVHAADDTFNDAMVELSDRPEGVTYEGVHQRADGSVFPVEVYMHTADVDGRPTIIKTIRDISERRLAAEQVALALDHALEASRLKSEFVATMSHEIRTPMHGVIGMSELLLETQLLPVQREYATTVKESAQALLAIIDDILDFSKLEANKIELEAVPFSPAHLVDGVLNLVRGAARDKGLRLRSYESPHVPAAVRGDPTRVRQVLINLIGNAVKFTAAGEVSATVSVEHEDGDLTLMFAISDTGIGVTPQARARLFQAFVQGDGSTTRRFGGTGLGLSICRRLVELMGGRIWLGEHEGPGSTFCFTARFGRTSEIVAPITLAAGALRVLVLDDDKATRKTFEATLTSWGMHNESSADIDSARTCLREAVAKGAPFDVVLIDYVLPRSDGLEFAIELGANADEYGTPARILVTAFDAEGRKAAALAAGCAGYLSKPIDPSQLYDALGGIVRERKAVDALGAGQRRARILMADDSALIRRVAHFQLEELHYGVDIVENGREAVTAVASGKYELVLMDMRMPEMDGLVATRAIREAERISGRHVVVVALTANVLEGDRKACVDAGMDDFLAKPLQLDALRTVLERWLPEAV